MEEEITASSGSEDCGELTELIDGLNIRKSFALPSERCRSQTVQLVLEDGHVLPFFTNRFNRISISSLERLLRKEVIRLEAPETGGGYKEMKVVEGQVKCPEQGWGDAQYRVFTEARSGQELQSPTSCFLT